MQVDAGVSIDLIGIIPWRATERLFSVVIGGFSIFLGYHLFLRLPNLPSDGEGKFELPGGVSIYISRIGPGIFFALFGTALVGFSLFNPLSIEQGGSAAPAPEPRPARKRRRVRLMGHLHRR